MFTKSAKNFSLVLFLIFGLLLSASACKNEAPIRIGYVAQLTGLRSDLGVDGRDGAQLAVDTINEKGGINGRSLELVIENNEGDPELTREIDKRLIDEGVVALIAHMTSGETAAVIDLVNESDTIMISPTTASDDFSSQADNFFRVMPATSLHGRGLANYIFHSRDLRHIVGVYDLANRSFSEPLWHTIQEEFQRDGGHAETEFPFTSEETDLQALAEEIVATNPEGVVFVASSVDVALLSQYIRQLDSDIPFFSSGWAFTDSLTEKGGSAIEGLAIVALFNPENSAESYITFADQFNERFNRPPSLGSVYAYEAVVLFAEAMRQADGQPDLLPETLESMGPVEGVQGTIRLDEFGDVYRDVYIAVVEDGQWQVVETVESHTN